MKKNNKLSIIFLLFSILNLTFCLESTDFCSLKYQEQKCHGLFSYRCDSIQLICSKGIKQCIEYKQKNTYIKLMYEYQKTNPLNKHVKERVTFKLFNKDIKNCKFKFKADDLCLNKKECTEKKLNQLNLASNYKYKALIVSVKHQIKALNVANTVLLIQKRVIILNQT